MRSRDRGLVHKVRTILGVLAAVTSAGAQLISRPVPPADAVERGERLFVASCGFCHGANAKGGEGGPDLVRSVLVLDDEDGDRVGPVILKGRSEKGMPAFSFSRAQISDIAAFLRVRTQAAIDRRAYPILDLATGDAKAGQAFFNGAGKCSTCHSPTGDLAGIASRYQPIALQSVFLYPSGRRQRPAEAAVTPRTGATVSGVLEYLDDFTVGVRDSAGYYRSFAREAVKVEVRDPAVAHVELLRQYTDTDIHNVMSYLVTLK
jgi:cytochrome c oxidase cbb3-type subunit III